MVQVPQTTHMNLLLTKGTSLKGTKKNPKNQTVLVQLAYFHTFVEWQQTRQGLEQFPHQIRLPSH